MIFTTAIKNYTHQMKLQVQFRLNKKVASFVTYSLPHDGTYFVFSHTLSAMCNEWGCNCLIIIKLFQQQVSVRSSSIVTSVSRGNKNKIKIVIPLSQNKCLYVCWFFFRYSYYSFLPPIINHSCNIRKI